MNLDTDENLQISEYISGTLNSTQLQIKSWDQMQQRQKTKHIQTKITVTIFQLKSMKAPGFTGKNSYRYQFNKKQKNKTF